MGNNKVIPKVAPWQIALTKAEAKPIRQGYFVTGDPLQALLRVYLNFRIMILIFSSVMGFSM